MSVTPIYHVGTCPQCEEPNRMIGPLHGEQGGPDFCLQCGMAWHGKHGRKRRFGRILKKAMKAFMAAEGGVEDIERLKGEVFMESLGYESLFDRNAADTIGKDVGDITTELLTDTLRLTHPDVHPPERRELATRVTRELNALAPYVFPAPKPDPDLDPKPDPDLSGAITKLQHDDTVSTAPPYPCVVCKDTIPYFYCAPCRSEFERRHKADCEKQNQKQRTWYRRRKDWQLQRRQMNGQLPLCATCRKQFEPKRKDAKYCTPACRQAAHRHRRPVTDKKSDHVEHLKSRNGVSEAAAP